MQSAADATKLCYPNPVHYYVAKTSTMINDLSQPGAQLFV